MKVKLKEAFKNLKRVIEGGRVICFKSRRPFKVELQDYPAIKQYVDIVPENKEN